MMVKNNLTEEEDSKNESEYLSFIETLPFSIFLIQENMMAKK